jgi:hypothetical protein
MQELSGDSLVALLKASPRKRFPVEELLETFGLTADPAGTARIVGTANIPWVSNLIESVYVEGGTVAYRCKAKNK